MCECLYICMCAACVQCCGSQKCRRGHQIPYGWSYIELSCRCWEVNLGPLKEHPVCLTTELSLQLLKQVSVVVVDIRYCRVTHANLELTTKIRVVSNPDPPESWDKTSIMPDC